MDPELSLISQIQFVLFQILDLTNKNILGGDSLPPEAARKKEKNVTQEDKWNCIIAP